jgi:hypothetical protein
LRFDEDLLDFEDFFEPVDFFDEDFFDPVDDFLEALDAFFDDVDLRDDDVLELLRFAPVDFEDEDFFEPAFFDDDFRAGTLPPASRASDRPMAMACLRLVTFLPEPPLFSVPRFRSCIARSTFSDALLPYLLAMQNLLHIALCK